MIDMAEIAPVRIQYTDSAVLASVAAHSADILIGILHLIDHLIPSAHSGADVLYGTGLSQLPRALLVLIRRVSPVQADRFLGKLPDIFRKSADYIAPEHRRLPLRHYVFAQFLHKINVHALNAGPLRLFCRLALSEVKRLIRSDIEVFR